MREWNAAIAHIENKLTEEITGTELSGIALSSEYHFRRMFATLVGMPLSEYIRNRRLTAATADILAGKSVLDTAVTYGYGSADAFTRAFKAFHGLTPTEARQTGRTLRSQSQLKIQISIEGSTNVPYRIVEKEAFQLVGFNTQIPIIHLGENTAIRQFEKSLNKDKVKALIQLSNVEPLGSLSVTEYLEGDDTQAIYWHAVATTQNPPHGVEAKAIPAGQWVVFSTEGIVPEAFQQLWATAASEWFPSNPYEWAPGPQLLTTELNETGEYGEAELWIPIAPK